MLSISIHSLQAAKSNSPLLLLLNLCIGLPSAFCLAAYFLSLKNFSEFFHNRCISVRSVKLSVRRNTIREHPKVRVIFPPPAPSPWDSSLIMVVCLNKSILLMTRERVRWCFLITQASERAWRSFDFFNNVAFCASIPIFIPASFLTSCIFKCPRRRCHSVHKAWFCIELWEDKAW